jgi:hypothetical protein
MNWYYKKREVIRYLKVRKKYVFNLASYHRSIDFVILLVYNKLLIIVIVPVLKDIEAKSELETFLVILPNLILLLF